MKGILKKGKQFAAATLAVALAFSGLPELGGVTAQAAELQSVALPVNGGGTISAYRWSGGNFDIEGIANPAAIGSAMPYTGNGIQATYGRGGYSTFLRAGATLDVAYNKGNGGVQEVAVPGGNVEFQVKTYPSKDGQLLLVDYTVYNNSNTTVNNVGMRSGADVNIGPINSNHAISGDYAPMTRTKDNISMRHPTRGDTFELITRDPSLGIDNRYRAAYGAEVPLETGGDFLTWMGHYSSRNTWNQDAETDNYISGVDTGLTYSWIFNLAPYQKVVKRVGFKTRGSTMYVNYAQGSDTTGTGEVDKPFQTLNKAVTEIRSKGLSPVMGYIYIQNYGEVDASNAMPVIGANETFILQSADYNKDKTSMTTVAEIKRKAGYTQPLITVNGGVRITNLILDGNKAGVANNESALIEGTGSVFLQRGAVLQNNTVATTANKGAAIHGPSAISMNYGTIKDNTSASGGAIYHNINSFTVTGPAVIKNNKNLASPAKDSNLVLTAGKSVGVAGPLVDTETGENAEIYVSPLENPAASIGGVVTAANQEVVIAEAVGAAAATVSAPPAFTPNFSLDNVQDMSDKGISLESGVNQTGTPAFNANAKKTVIRREGRTITFERKEYPDEGELDLALLGNGGVPLDEMPVVASDKNQAISTIAPPSGTKAPQGGHYVLHDVRIDQGANTSLTKDAAHNVSGVMPDYDVTITYLYKKQNSTISFDSNGGTPATINSRTGTRNELLDDTGLPTVTKYGYQLINWVPTPSSLGSPLTASQSLPNRYPLGDISYKAMWQVDNGIKSFYTVLHTTTVQGLQDFFNTHNPNPLPQEYPVETAISAQPLNIPGYEVIAKTDTPSGYVVAGTTAAFNPANNHYAAKMPTQDVEVKYEYGINGAASAKKNFTVEYYDNLGAVIQPPVTTQHSAEEPISNQAPDSISGKNYARTEVRAGHIANPSAWEYAINPVTSIDALTRTFSATMPNQNVVIRHIYGGVASGQQLVINYEDQLFNDPALRKLNVIGDDGTPLANPLSTPVQGNTPIPEDITSYVPVWGYSSANFNNGGHTSITVNPDSKLRGTMPTTDATVTYAYVRDASKWGTIIYKPMQGATLSNTAPATSVDLTATAGGFKAPVLKDGDTSSYTFGLLETVKLVPNVVITEPAYYSQDGWYIDLDDNGKFDGSDVRLDATTTFVNAHFNTSGEAIVRPNIIKTPGQWVDISLRITNGKWNDTNDSLDRENINVKVTETFNSLSTAGIIPATTGRLNYVNTAPGGGWKLFGNAVNPTAAVADGNVYEMIYVRDPAIFGTNPSAKNADGSIEFDGKGAVTVYETKSGYNYVLTDLAGNVIDVVSGTDFSDTVKFTGKEPGTQYKVYEVRDNQNPAPGSNISAIPAGDISPETLVTVPVLDNNYNVNFDEADPNNQKTKIVINPADPAMEYALVDEHGNLVTTSPEAPSGWQGDTGTPASVTFSNLDIGKTYTVVTRPRGGSDTHTSRLPGGSSFVADPGFIGEIPKFTVRTRNAGAAITKIVDKDDATVDKLSGTATDNYLLTVAGDTVHLAAPATNAGGHAFKNWTITIGSLSSTLSGATPTFVMPRANVVVTANYDEPATPVRAQVIDEVRGGSAKQIALDPEEVDGLKNALTRTPEDTSLLNDNPKVDVTYKVVYNKKPESAYHADVEGTHNGEFNKPDAFTLAWELSVDIERYVDGRKVSVAGHPENYAGTFKTYVQLDAKDVDMLNYRLYEITPGAPATITAHNWDDNPTDTGLLSFDAKTGKKYVLAYSKAFKVSFVNDHVDRYPTPAAYADYKLGIKKVIKGDDASAAKHEWEVTDGKIPLASYRVGRIDYLFNDPGNAGWSKSATSFNEFDFTEAITKPTKIYAYYKDNSAAVTATTGTIEDALKELEKLSKDGFLKRAELAEINNTLAVFKTVLNRPGLVDYIENQGGDPKYLTMNADELRAVIDDPATPATVRDALQVREPNLTELQAILNFQIGPRNPVTGAIILQSVMTGVGPATPGSIRGSLINPVRNNVLQPRYNSYSGINSGRSSGGHSGSSGGTGTGSASRPFTTTSRARNYTVGGNGNWEQRENGRWSFALNAGIRLTSRWANLEYTSGDKTADGWYHFNSHGLMDIGWFKDEKGDWYYCNTEKDGFQGKMKSGWHQDSTDGKRYYLGPDGRMRTGWVEIDGKWYFFHNMESTKGETYSYDAKTESWSYINNGIRPLGSMYVNETTPDGYRVGPDGAWIQ